MFVPGSLMNTIYQVIPKAFITIQAIEMKTNKEIEV